MRDLTPRLPAGPAVGTIVVHTPDGPLPLCVVRPRAGVPREICVDHVAGAVFADGMVDLAELFAALAALHAPAGNGAA